MADIINTNRAEWCIEAFQDKLDVIADVVTIIKVEPDDWSELAETPQAISHLHPLGFWPVTQNLDPDAGPAFVVAFCPEVLVAATTHLDVDDFESFLVAATLLIKHAFTFWDSGLDELGQVRAAEDVMASDEDATFFLNLLTQVHMRALD